MKKSRNNFIKENFFQSLDYIKESKNFIYAAIGVFSFFIFLGAFLPVPEFIEQQILDFIAELLKRTEGMSWSQLTGFIFFNNLQSSFFGMILGVVFGIYSLLVIVVNGYVLGFVASRTASEAGIFVLWRLLPHGIFELPAVLISMGLGLRLGTFIFRKNKIKTLKSYFLNSIKTFIFVILPLLIIAALIEGTLIAIS